MNMFVRSAGALALLALGACTTPQQLADEGRLREASLALDPSDYDALAHVAYAVAREVEAEVVLRPLDDEELFAALGFVPERFADESALLVYWRSQAGALPGDRLGLLLDVAGYSGAASLEDVVQAPPAPTDATTASGSNPLLDLLSHVGGALADRFMPDLRRTVNDFLARRGPAEPGPDAADVQRRARALRRLRSLLALGDAGPGPRRWGFLVLTGARPPAAAQVRSTLWVEWTEDLVSSPTYYPPEVDAPGDGGLRERLRALSARGPLVLRSSDRPAFELDPTRAALVTDECRRAIRLTADPESYFDRGLLLALADERATAAADFASALELGGPAVVYYALWGAAMGLPLSTLEPHTSAPWPGPVTRLFLARTPFDQLLAEAHSVADERDRRGRVCEAHCYAGLLAERDGDLPSAQAHYRAAVDTQRTDFIEFAWAEARLARR